MQPVRGALTRIGFRTPFQRDALLAASVILISLAGTWFAFDVDTTTPVTDLPLGRLLGSGGAVIIGGSALAWRRRTPVTVAVIAAFALVVETVLAPNLQAASVSVWVALYSVGAYAGRARAVM